MSQVSCMVSPLQPAFAESRRHGSSTERANIEPEDLYGPEGAQYFRKYGRPGVVAWYAAQHRLGRVSGITAAEVESELEASAPPAPKPIVPGKPQTKPAAAPPKQTAAASPAAIAQKVLSSLKPEKTAAQKLTEGVASEFKAPEAKADLADLTGQTPAIKTFAASLKLPENKSAGVGALPSAGN